jgi:diacylglycerol kinase (ATP)
MNKNKPFSLLARFKSIGYALEGIVIFFKTEHNALIHLAATIVVILLSIFFPISKIEALALVLTIGLVWVAEIFNTALEKAMDFISDEQLHAIKNIKDLSAAAVLVAAIIAIIVGGIVFIPKF